MADRGWKGQSVAFPIPFTRSACEYQRLIGKLETVHTSLGFEETYTSVEKGRGENTKEESCDRSPYSRTKKPIPAQYEAIVEQLTFLQNAKSIRSKVKNHRCEYSRQKRTFRLDDCVCNPLYLIML